MIGLFMQDPPDRAYDDDQTSCECVERFHAVPSWMVVAGWTAFGSVSLYRAATGCEAQHCATTSRAQSSQRPHWVATPSSNWISSKLIPARAWRAISRSETRWQTQTIMVQAVGLAMDDHGIINANSSHLQSFSLQQCKRPSPSTDGRKKTGMSMPVFCAVAPRTGASAGQITRRACRSGLPSRTSTPGACQTLP